MKNKLLFTSAIVLSTGIAFAKDIDFDTVIRWNSEVISAALSKAGFITSSNAAWDVKKTHERILNELVQRESFSLRDATQVCLDKCSMSDLLRKGQGQSHKACPDLCAGFVDALIAENNRRVDTSVLNPDVQDSSMKHLQDTPAKACRKLAQNAQTQGLTLPMLCGGMCKRRGDDNIIVTDYDKTIEYKIDDFCDNSEKNREYFYIVSSNGEIDVTKYSEQERLVKLKETQMQPVADYRKQEEIQKKESAYAKRVKRNGNCSLYETNVRGPELDQVDRVSNGEKNMMKNHCRRECYKYAQSNACKIHKVYYSAVAAYKAYGSAETSGWGISGHCGCNGITWSEQYVDKTAYTPTYQDCMGSWRDEKKCNQ